MKYFIITPAKNEEKYIRFTLDSMVKQTLKPEQWVIVDDGSTDRTRDIAESYAKEYPWIKVVAIPNDHGKKLYGSKVIRAFNHGYNLIKDQQYDFIVKWDADLSFPETYFEQISDAFSTNKKLGICGGYIVENEYTTVIKPSRHPRVQGAIKAVSAQCFREIGGFRQENGWDGIDMLHAWYLGWEVNNIPVNILHHRIQTTEYRSCKFFRDNGITHYKQGNDLLLTLIRIIIMLKEKPYFIVSYCYLSGYLKALITREPKIVDKDFAKFIRSYHYKRLLSFNR